MEMKVDSKNTVFLTAVSLLAVISVVMVAAQSGNSKLFSPYVDSKGLGLKTHDIGSEDEKARD